MKYFGSSRCINYIQAERISDYSWFTGYENSNTIFYFSRYFSWRVGARGINIGAQIRQTVRGQITELEKHALCEVQVVTKALM